MKGRLTPDLAACIAIELFESGGWHDVIVDTGFNDYLNLPEDKIVAWSLPFIATVPVTLADQSTLIADMYEANLVWFGFPLRVTVVAGPYGSDSLLGMRLLKGCRIELDWMNGEVRIEPLYEPRDNR